MRRYETIFIMDPDLSDEGRVPVFERLNDLIPAQGGILIEMDEWGSRRLAYEIKKKVRGYYVRADYCGAGAVVDEMERFFRIDDRVLKYMTVLLDEDADPESLLAKPEAEETEDGTDASVENEDAGTEETESTPEKPAEEASAPAGPETGDVKGEASKTEETIKEA